MRWPRGRPRHVRVDLAESAESKAKKAAEADWEKVRAHVAEHRKLRDENHFGERFRAAFEQARPQESP